MAQKKRGSDRASLKIPSLVYERLEQLIEGTGFRSVTEFAVYVLRDLIATHGTSGNEACSPDELERVKERLRALGYM